LWIDLKKEDHKGTGIVCLREFDFEVLLRNTTFQEREISIDDHTEDTYPVLGGYKVKGVTLFEYNFRR
jgi:hypothetical protein